VRIDPAALMGGITGAMTDTACLDLVCDEARSSVPDLGYAGRPASSSTSSGARRIGGRRRRTGKSRQTGVDGWPMNFPSKRG
jgi:hypothetical protein